VSVNLAANFIDCCLGRANVVKTIGDDLIPAVILASTAGYTADIKLFAGAGEGDV